MVKFATNISGAILLPSSIQVTESISGSVMPLAMFERLLSSWSRNIPKESELSSIFTMSSGTTVTQDQLMSQKARDSPNTHPKIFQTIPLPKDSQDSHQRAPETVPIT